MSYAIIVRGPAGVGKSTIAQRLAKELNAYYVSFDKVLSDNSLDIIKNGWIQSDNFIKADEIILPDVLKNINDNKIVIFDGCFYHLSQIEDLKSKIPANFFIFSLKADIKECLIRDISRTGLAGMGDQRIIDVYKLVAKVDCGISIETNQKKVEDIIKDIKSFLP